MTAVHESAYPRLNSKASAKQLKRAFTPQKTEWHWVKSKRINETAKLGYVVLLKCFQRLGYFPDLIKIPLSVMDHVAEHIEIAPPIEPDFLFTSEKALQRAKDAIREYCQVNKYQSSVVEPWLKEFAIGVLTA